MLQLEKHCVVQHRIHFYHYDIILYFLFKKSVLVRLFEYVETANLSGAQTDRVHFVIVMIGFIGTNES